MDNFNFWANYPFKVILVHNMPKKEKYHMLWLFALLSNAGMLKTGTYNNITSKKWTSQLIII